MKIPQVLLAISIVLLGTSHSFAGTTGKAAPNGISEKIRDLGKQFGFDIPLTKEDFLRRYSTAGGQCGVQPGSETLKAVVPLMTSSCWAAPCPAFSADLDCRVVRIGFDSRGHLVLFNTSLKEKTIDPLKNTFALSVIAGRMTERSGKSPDFRSVPNGTLIINGANEGPLRYEFNVTSLKGEPEGGLFWITAN